MCLKCHIKIVIVLGLKVSETESKQLSTEISLTMCLLMLTILFYLLPLGKPYSNY